MSVQPALAPDPSPVPALGPGPDLRGTRSGRRADRAFSGVSLAAGLVVLAVLALVVVSTTSFAWPALRRAGLGYLTGRVWSSESDVYGALPLVVGTLTTLSLIHI